MNQIKVKLTKKQTQCWDAFWSPTVNSILFGGAMGGGKSYIGCLLLFHYACWVMEKYNLSASKYPLLIGFMGRNRGVDFNDTTLETWKRIILEDHYEIKMHDKEIIVKGAVKYAFGGLDRQEDISKFSSAEYAVTFIDQAEECDRNSLAILRSRFRVTINGEPLPYKELYTANPANCWLKDEFVLGNNPHKVYIPALPNENPNLPDSYIASLQEAFKHRPELLLAYLEGSWDSLEGADIVIKDIWIREAKKVVKTYIGRPLRVFGVDVARFGDDLVVCYEMEGTNIVDEMIFGQKDTMYTAGKIHIWAKEKQPDLIGVDVVGLGAGVADRLSEMGNNVLDVNVAEKAEEETKFKNLRAEIWWNAGRRFSEKDIKLTWNDPELARELSAVSYFIKNGKIQIEPKDKIKERLGRSPDKAEAYLIGLHTLDNAVISDDYHYGDWEEEASYKQKCNVYTGL